MNHALANDLQVGRRVFVKGSCGVIKYVGHVEGSSGYTSTSYADIFIYIYIYNNNNNNNKYLLDVLNCTFFSYIYSSA